MYITLLFLVLPTWSLIANSDSLTVAQLTSVPTVNKSQFFLSKITAPNTFHFLTSAFYPVMRRWGKLSWNDPRVPEPLREKFGYSFCHLSNWTKSQPPILTATPHGLSCVSAMIWAGRLKGAANILAWLLKCILKSLPLSSFWWILF